MTTQTVSDPTPFFFEGGPVGALLVHGFTGAPAEMRLVGRYLYQQGLTISAPLLPGHGTNIDDCNQRNWREWTDYIAQELVNLQKRCEIVFIGGLSMGSLISLYTAANTPELAGVIMYSPAVMVTDMRRHFLPIAKYLVKQIPKPDDDFTDPEAASLLWDYDGYPVAAAHELMKLTEHVKKSLPDITCPCLIIQSTGDESIHPDSAQYVYDNISATDKEMITLHNSGHVLTLDSEWEKVAQDSYQFIKKIAPVTVEQN